MISTVNQKFSIKVKDTVISHSKINEEEKNKWVVFLTLRYFPDELWSSENWSSSPSSADRRAVDCKASPAGSVLGSAQDVILWEMLIGVDLFLDLAGKGLLQSPCGSSPVEEEGLIQRVDVSGCGLQVSPPFGGVREDTQECSLTARFVRHNLRALYAQNLTKELELT